VILFIVSATLSPSAILESRAICRGRGAGVTLPTAYQSGTALPEQEIGRLSDATAAVRRLTQPGRRLAASLFEKPVAGRIAVLGGAVAMTVAAMLVGLPVKPVVAQPVPYATQLAPQAPQASAQGKDTSLPLDVALQIRFTKPMNESTVESALTISPTVGVAFNWDALGQVLSLAPDPHWQPSTDYTVQVSANASDHEGLGLTAPITTSFRSGPLTSGQIAATKTVDGLAAPTTTFQVTFSRPVKLATVLMRLAIDPPVEATVAGDDPTDAASQVFTLTPKVPLATNTPYHVGFVDGGTDAASSQLQPVLPLDITTLQAPSVVKVTPQGGTFSYDTHQVISVVFSVPMDEKSTAAALSIKANGRAIPGSTVWTQDDTVLVFSPRHSYYLGSTIVVGVATSARSTGGLTMKDAVRSTFVVTTPRGRRLIGKITGTKIPWIGGIASSSAPWHSAEMYYLSLLNCTRTGKWVTSTGLCSTQTHHTLPAQAALPYRSDIADGAARPYARELAIRNALTHTLDGTTIRTRLAAAGIYPSTYGENISSPGNASASGMIAAELFFQNEYWNRGGHYANIMNPKYRSVGVGVWQQLGRTRVVIDFAG
jgi:hypothetical protein